MPFLFPSFARIPFRSLLGVAVCGLLALSLHAHPVVRGDFDVRIESACVRLTATVSMEEVLLASTLGTGPVPASMDEAIQRHGQYILKHVSLSSDDSALQGTLNSSRIIKDGVERVQFDFEFRSSKSSAPTPPTQVRIAQTMLNDIQVAPAGDAWEAAYVLKIGMENGARVEGLLARDKPVTFKCTWNQPNKESAKSSAAPSPLFPALFISITFVILVLVARLLERRKKS